MKRLFYLAVYVIAFAMVLSSCNTLQYEGRCGGAEVISKSSKEGKVYGLRWGNEVALAPSFLFFGEGIDMGSIYFSNDKKVCYLFDNGGTEILTGRQGGKKELGFEPLPIVVKDGPTPHQITSRAGRYFDNIFSIGKYYLFEIADGTLYALFDNIGYQVYGPFKQFFPGCSGYIYKDVKTCKWGAVGSQRIPIDRYGRYKITVEDQDLFQPEYDEIIEVVRSAGDHVWLARKGNTWSAKSISISEDLKTTQIKNAQVDRRLLNRVLKMPLRKEAKGRKDGLSYEMLPNQRIGSREASIAFL